jgi:hypothetical protein
MGLFENRIKSLESAANKVLNEYAPPSNPFLRNRQNEVSTMQDRENQLSAQKGLSRLFGGGSIPSALGGLKDIGKSAMSSVYPFYKMNPMQSDSTQSQLWSGLGPPPGYKSTQPEPWSGLGPPPGYKSTQPEPWSGLGPPPPGFGGSSRPTQPQVDQKPTVPGKFKSYGSDNEFYERMAELKAQREEEKLEARKLKRQRDTFKVEKDAQGNEYSPVDAQGQGIKQGLQGKDAERLDQLRASERESSRQMQFLRSQRSRERTKEYEQKSLEQAKRIGY